MMTDPIADMLTRMRNALRIRRKKVKMPRSSIKIAIAEVLKREGYIEGFRTLDSGPMDNMGKQGWIELDLKYGPEGEDVISRITRQSKPGCRVFKQVEELPLVLNGLGISVLSTSKGVISDREAREQRIGGEILFQVT